MRASLSLFVLGLIQHTDQEVQYSSAEYKALLTSHDMIQNISRKGNCHNNAVAETLFSNLKNKLIYHKNIADPDEA